MSTQTISIETKVADYKNDHRLGKQVREFLKGLNEGGAPPIESLSPAEARKVLSDAQASVSVDLSGIEEVEKTITADGYTLKLNIVRPEGKKKRCRFLCSFTVVAGCLEIIQLTKEW